MIAYLDTSALVKKYVREEGTDEVLRLWRGSEHIAISRVGYAEAQSTFRRKGRENEEATVTVQSAISELKSDWKTFVIVEVTRALELKVDRLLAVHPLRGFDVIHLASALTLSDSLETEIVFCCRDERLLHAAHIEGLVTVPAEGILS